MAVDRSDLLPELCRLFEAGECVPHIERSFSLGDVADAYRFFLDGKVRGKVEIEMES